MYKYFKADEYALANLANCQLYCHHFEDFNDPFECWCEEIRSIPDPITEPDRFTAVRDAWGGPANTREELDSFIEYVDSLIDYPWSKVDGMKHSARISCFSETGDNLLMWAHYGDGLRGFCIEFDTEELARGTPSDADILKVEYRTAPVVFDLCLYEVACDQMEWHEDQIDEANAKGESVGGGLDAEFRRVVIDSRALMREMYSKLLATKPMEWHYENESRLIFHSDATDHSAAFFKYTDASIKSVILGDRISPEHRATISRILIEKSLTVPVMVAARDPSSFKVNIR
jgi:hypothetical protein